MEYYQNNPIQQQSQLPQQLNQGQPQQQQQQQQQQFPHVQVQQPSRPPAVGQTSSVKKTGMMSPQVHSSQQFPCRQPA